MPLFMDLHKMPNITVDEAKKAHLADEYIQGNHGVKYLQFWINEQAGLLFCLVEGPDKAAVEHVHREAHGHMACAVVEVDPSYCSLIMGDNVRIDGGVVHRESGSIDPGTRFILTVSFYGDASSESAKAREAIVNNFAKHGGRRVKLSGEDNQVCVFDSADEAFLCAKEIQAELSKNHKKTSFSIGLSAGQPLTENNEFIEETVRLAKRLCLVAEEGHVIVSPLFSELCNDDLTKKGAKKVRQLNPAEETFITQCFDIMDEQLSNESFHIDTLVKAVGMSRAQLYRKIQALAGKAPNSFIRDLRLEKARGLLKRKTGNVAEVAYEVGFSNPSYFAKCFAKRFGCLPSQLV
ncbi:MAG TPA: nickel-binding protein [Cyclobacteriaceae bacterium]